MTSRKPRLLGAFMIPRLPVGIVVIGWMSLGFITAEEPRPNAAVAESADTEEEAVRAERSRYSGTWRVVSIEANGNRAPDDGRRILVTNRIDGSWLMSIDGTEVNRGTSRIDPLAQPPEIDLDITDGEGQGRKLLGIYEITGKTRRLCFRGEDAWRPREFRTTSGCGAILVRFERQE